MSYIVNFFGGPGAGKSTGAAGLFHMMKTKGHNVELIVEYARELVYRKDFETLRNQFYVSATQDYRQRRLLGKADFIITDSPIILGCYYDKGQTPGLSGLLIDRFKTYTNINIVAERDSLFSYSSHGRVHTFEEALEADQTVLNILAKYDIKYKTVNTRQVGSLDSIYDYVLDQVMKLKDKAI